jgi:hypothetical protein
MSPKGVIPIGRPCRRTVALGFSSRVDRSIEAADPRRAVLLVLAVASAAIVLVAFLLDLIVNDPVSVAAMLVIVVLAVVLDLVWRARDGRGPASAPTNTIPPRTTEEGGDTSAAGHQGPVPSSRYGRPHVR